MTAKVKIGPLQAFALLFCLAFISQAFGSPVCQDIFSDFRNLVEGPYQDKLEQLATHPEQVPFATIEGGEGSGKSTIARRLQDYYREHGRSAEKANFLFFFIQYRHPVPGESHSDWAEFIKGPDVLVIDEFDLKFLARGPNTIIGPGASDVIVTILVERLDVGKTTILVGDNASQIITQLAATSAPLSARLGRFLNYVIRAPNINHYN